jgi:hypothetical protein
MRVQNRDEETMNTQTNDDNGFGPFRNELAELRRGMGNATTEEERREAVVRMAEINREVNADTYERLRYR